MLMSSMVRAEPDRHVDDPTTTRGVVCLSARQRPVSGTRPEEGYQWTDRPTEPWAPSQLCWKAMIPSVTRACLWLPV